MTEELALDAWVWVVARIKLVVALLLRARTDPMSWAKTNTRGWASKAEVA
jgi:hypothetical protein